jgi:hypothetical protein
MLWSALLLGLMTRSEVAAPRVAVLSERGFPYFAANELVSPRRVLEGLHALGIEAALVSPQDLQRGGFGVLVSVYGNTFPREALPALTAFRRAGGAVVSTGVPFTHPCVLDGGRWRDEGHEDHTGPEETNTGQVRFLAEAATRYSVPEGDPLEMRELLEGLAGSVRGSPAVFDPRTVRGRNCTPALLAHTEHDSGPVAVLIEGAEGVGPTAMVGLTHFTDPREPQVILLQEQLLLRAVGWCLDCMGTLTPDGFRARCAALMPRLPTEVRPVGPSEAPERLFPLPAEPAATLTVFDVRGLSRDEQLLAVSVQGLVNQSRPSIYLLWDGHDEFWLQWMRQEGLIGNTETVPDLRALVERSRAHVAGAVVTDERWVNVACMAAGARRLAITTPELARQHGLPVALDLPAMGWRRDLEGYEWARRELGPDMGRRVLGHVSVHSAPMSRDFLIAQRAFLFWMPGAVDGGDEGADPLGALLFARRLLAETPPHVPVCGWWGWGDPYEGIGEYWGMTLASRFGKTTPGTEFASNLSLLSAVRVPAAKLRRQRPPRSPPSPDQTKAYVALSVLDSGDAVWYNQRRQREVWADPARGTVPIGWSITPSLLDFAPPIAAWYQQQASDRDELIAAATGLNYCSLREYGTAFQNAADVRRQYLSLTDRYMQRLEIGALMAYIDHWGAPTDVGDGGVLSECAQAMPGLRVLLPDLGRPDEVTPANANHVLRGGVPVFHTLTRWRPWQSSADIDGRAVSAEVGGLVEGIRAQTPPTRPCFISAFPLSWTMPPTAIRQTVEALPPDYVPVLPGELARLFLTTGQAAPGEHR